MRQKAANILTILIAVLIVFLSALFAFLQSM